MLCDALYYSSWFSSNIIYESLVLHASLRLNLCRCSWGHKGLSKAGMSYNQECSILRDGLFIPTSHRNDYTTQICLDNNSHLENANNRSDKFECTHLMTEEFITVSPLQSVGSATVDSTNHDKKIFGKNHNCSEHYRHFSCHYSLNNTIYKLLT